MAKPLSAALKDCAHLVQCHLALCDRTWEGLLDAVECAENSQSGGCLCDEELWTFLASCGYAAAGSDGVGAFEQSVAPGNPVGGCGRIWLEARPVPPRREERNTRLDIAVGDVVRRDQWVSGVQCEGGAGSWACFCECKWYSDVSLDVVADAERNQLTRILDNLLCFQGPGGLVADTWFTLITPAIFKPSPWDERADARLRRPFSRLYQYKFVEYEREREVLIRELDICPLRVRNEAGWSYPTEQIAARAKRVRFTWVTFDELLAGVPGGSPLRPPLMDFWAVRGAYQGRVL